MNQKAILLMTALSLGLLACSGGGGGGSTAETTTTTTTTPTTPTTPTLPTKPTYEGGKTKNGVPLIAAPTAKKRYGGNTSLTTAFSNFDTIETRTDLPGYIGYPVQLQEKVTLPDGRVMKLWGFESEIVTIDDQIMTGDTKLVYSRFRGRLDELRLVQVGQYSFLDKNGKAYSFYSIDDIGAVYSNWKVRPTTNWTWTDAAYNYTAINQSTGETYTGPTHYDGMIVANNGKWDAKFGNVSLDGTVVGNEVSGTATGNFFGQSLKGKFAGIDGLYGPQSRPADQFPITVGGFAGGNSNASFAGTWTGSDIVD